jgi:beta-phosphoglucomutase-like phosphatase (HAD superfamily)
MFELGPQFMCGGSQTTRSKPDPEVFLKTADALKLPSRSCIVIEDSRNGIQAARNAGMKVVVITTSLKREEIFNVDMIITDFNELNFDKLNNI